MRDKVSGLTRPCNWTNRHPFLEIPLTEWVYDDHPSYNQSGKRLRIVDSSPCNEVSWQAATFGHSDRSPPGVVGGENILRRNEAIVIQNYDFIQTSCVITKREEELKQVNVHYQVFPKFNIRMRSMQKLQESKMLAASLHVEDVQPMNMISTFWYYAFTVFKYLLGLIPHREQIFIVVS